MSKEAIAKVLSLIFLTTMGACNDNVGINKIVFLEHIKSEKSIILSCTHCSCVTSFLNSIDFYNDKSNSIIIYADSNCIGTQNKFQYKQLNQSVIDSIFENNYNIILFKKAGRKINKILLKTEQSNDFNSIFKKFFLID